ncbi:MAG: prolipoprotein diacylglyceryl transferase [Nitrospirota bacterium]
MYPILFKIGEFEIRSYGVMIALASLTATFVGVKEAKRRGMDPDMVFDFLFYALLFGIVGARIYYVLFSDLKWFLIHPLEIPAIWKGGIAIHGGLIGGLAAGIWFSRKKGISFWRFGDLLAPSIIIGQAIGRGACTLNGCSYGKPTDLFWAIVFTNPDSMAPLGIPLHPTQFYELFTDLVIFVVIWNLRKKMRFDGQLFLIYGTCYGIARFIIEFFRGDSLIFWNIMPAAHVTSILIVITTISLYFRLAKQGAVQ